MNKDKFLFLIINIIVSILLGVFFSNYTIIVINTIMLIPMLIIIGKSDKKIYRHLLIIYLVSIIAMLLLYFGYINKYGEPYYSGGSDDKNFELWAKESIKLNNFSIKDIIETKKFRYFNCTGFIWLMSMLIRLSNIFDGYHTIIIRLLNIYFTMFTGILCYKYFSNKEKNISNKIKILYLVCLFPNALYVTIHGFRDAIYTFIIFSVFYLLNYIKDKKIFSKILIIVYLILTTYITYYIRKVGVLYIGIIIVLNLLFKNSKITEKKEFLKAIILGVAVLLLGIKSGIIGETEQYLDRYNGYILNGASGLSSMVFTTPILPFGIFLRIIYGLIFPAPTGLIISIIDVDSICKFIISIGTIYQIYMLPYLIKNIKKFDKVFLIFIIIFFSIVVATFSFRHYLMLYPFMFILINRTKDECSSIEKKKNFFFMTLVLILGILFYLLATII